MDSQRYDELHGSNNWDGLLDPLDLDLRNLLIGYGDLSSAAERAFNNDEGSLYTGYSYYGKSSFFKGVMLPWADSKYQVTSFIYATARVDSNLPFLFPGISREGSEFESNWMGFVAVSSDEYSEFIGRREICVVWRGTARTYEWIDDIAGVEPIHYSTVLTQQVHQFQKHTLVMVAIMDSQRYDELHGSNNWDGLLDPLDLDLRNLLISYGDLSSAAERAFNNDEGSLYTGYSYYGKSSFFKGVMLPWADSKYQVTSFIYATARVDANLPFLFPGISREGSEFESNWMGYVAVSSDEYSEFIGRREICVVWRGTVRTYEWIDDIAGAEPVPAEPLLPRANSTDPDTPKVMGGWLTIYNTSNPNSEFIPSSARTQLLERIKELLGKYKNEKVSITCTGHSLGACLAVLSAFDVARNVVTPDINVSAFIFACPQVGNQSFKEKMQELPNLKVLRVKNDPDIIPFWPSKIIKWVSDNIWERVPSELLEYVDVGVELWINSKKSPYLKEESKLNGMLHPLVYHNLQGMLHTLSGWNGKNGDFDWGLVKRSLGWVNLSNDLLKKEFKIPVSWWAEKNKGLVLNDHGDWVLAPLDRHDHDLPV